MARGDRLRFVLFRAAIIIAFAAIAMRLWELQILSAHRFQSSADQNRFRLVPIDAPRGIIYDRYGQLLVRNVPSFVVSIVPAGLPDDPVQKERVLQRLSQLLGIPVRLEQDESGAEAQAQGIEEILQTRTTSQFLPVPIATNVDRQVAFLIEEEHLELPGVVIATEPLRFYPYGPLTSHILGYVGHIPRERLDDYEEKGYQPNDLVGLTGIELTYERFLRGVKGQKHIEVDAFEREIRVIASEPPIQGDSLVLTIDLELQQAVEKALREGMRKANSEVGVAIVMDPRTGEIRAMVSLPSYDANLFSGGISFADYQALSQDPRRPLVNHAISGQYPPGSTFKIVPASGALEDGIIDQHTQFVCRGKLLLPNKLFPGDPTQAQEFFCWRKAGHGPLNVVQAIAHSCDIFFYKLAGGYENFPGMGIERLAYYAQLFGFGERSHIDLPGEAAGLLPSDRWKRHTYGESWFTGDTYNAAIGQGFVLATPLQVLNATAAVANGGTLYRPQLVYRIVDAEGRTIQRLSPEIIRQLPISEENLALVRQGMRDAVVGGTAWLLRLPEVAVAGKTGTAEYPAVDEEGNLILDEEGHLPTHAWFTAFAPYEEPEIALVVFLAGGGEGSQVAVPVASEILRYYFQIPEPTPVPTGTPAQ